MHTILVTGGAGYIGCVLVPKLLRRYRVIVLDACWFGDESLKAAVSQESDAFTFVRGDIRDREATASVLAAHQPDIVIHLAAVSNDPCSELDADLTKSVNLDASVDFMAACKGAGVRRFINASSASVYGIKEVPDVTEDLTLDPLTLYARYKVATEKALAELLDEQFCGVSVRAATVCGYSPRLRLDLTINILTHHALTSGEIRVFGGEQLRPNIHIQDLTDFYRSLVELDRDVIQGKAFNVVRRNSSVMALAEMIRDKLEGDLSIKIVPTEDKRSYHLSAEKAQSELGFEPVHPLSLAIEELQAAYRDGRVSEPDHIRYRNVEVMKLHPERTSFP